MVVNFRNPPMPEGPEWRFCQKPSEPGRHCCLVAEYPSPTKVNLFIYSTKAEVSRCLPAKIWTVGSLYRSRSSCAPSCSQAQSQSLSLSLRLSLSLFLSLSLAISVSLSLSISVSLSLSRSLSRAYFPAPSLSLSVSDTTKSL